jgi:hypothetical protein
MKIVRAVFSQKIVFRGVSREQKFGRIRVRR